MTKTFQQIKEQMAKKRSVKHWTQKDIKSILLASETGNWSIVHESKLYNQYGGEYCSLLEVLNGVKKIGA